MESLWEDWERDRGGGKISARLLWDRMQLCERAGERLVQGTGANEVIAVTDTYEPQARLESYRRLAGLLAD